MSWPCSALDAAVHWSWSVVVNDVNKLVRKASSWIGKESLEATVMEMRMLSKMVSIFYKTFHPHHDMLVEIKSISSQRHIPPRCSSKQHEWT